MIVKQNKVLKSQITDLNKAKIHVRKNAGRRKY